MGLYDRDYMRAARTQTGPPRRAGLSSSGGFMSRWLPRDPVLAGFCVLAGLQVVAFLLPTVTYQPFLDEYGFDWMAAFGRTSEATDLDGLLLGLPGIAVMVAGLTWLYRRSRLLGLALALAGLLPLWLIQRSPDWAAARTLDYSPPGSSRPPWTPGSRRTTLGTTPRRTRCTHHIELSRTRDCP